VLDEAPINLVWGLSMLLLAGATLFVDLEIFEDVPRFVQASIWLGGSLTLFLFAKYSWAFFVGTLPLAIYIILTVITSIVNEQWSLEIIFHLLLFYLLNREKYNNGR
jgi:hypothetical protein